MVTQPKCLVKLEYFKKRPKGEKILSTDKFVQYKFNIDQKEIEKIIKRNREIYIERGIELYKESQIKKIDKKSYRDRERIR